MRLPCFAGLDSVRMMLTRTQYIWEKFTWSRAVARHMRDLFPSSAGNWGDLMVHIGVDYDSRLVHSVATTAANVADVTQASKLLHGEENVRVRRCRYAGVGKREEGLECGVRWEIAARAGVRSERCPRANSKPARSVWNTARRASGLSG